MRQVKRLLAWAGVIEGDTPPPTEKRLAENFKAFFEATYGAPLPPHAAVAAATPAVASAANTATGSDAGTTTPAAPAASATADTSDGTSSSSSSSSSTPSTSSAAPDAGGDDAASTGAPHRTATGCPNFEPLSYLSALEKAKAQMKCLFVYLHGPRHFNSGAFCRQLCGSAPALRYIEEGFLCWGASAGARDGYNAAIDFNATDFPFVAVVCPGVPAAQVIFRASGRDAMVGPAVLAERIQQAMAANQALVDQAREIQRVRDRDRMLTRQQDLDYEAAMQLDRERTARERAARDVERAAAREVAAREEEERRKAAEAAARKENRLDDARRVVGEELAPEPTAKPYAVLRFRLPDGQRLGRRFTPDTTLRQLHAYVIVALADRGSPIRRFNLFHNTKRRVIVGDGGGGGGGGGGGEERKAGGGAGEGQAGEAEAAEVATTDGGGGGGGAELATTTLEDVGLSADVLLVQDLDA